MEDKYYTDEENVKKANAGFNIKRTYYLIKPEEKDLYDHSVTNKEFDQQAMEDRMDQEITEIIKEINKKIRNNEERKNF